MNVGSPRVSVVVPALDEEAEMPSLIAGLEAQAGVAPFEVVLADGGSRDATVARFQALTSRWDGRLRSAAVVRCESPGRAAQMNAGARAGAGEIIVFLHADTTLPPEALAAVAAALEEPLVAGGGFRLAYRERDPRLRLVAAWATLRSRLTGVHYGDQAIFVRRVVFDAIGGVPDVPLFEDLLLSRALRRRGRAVTLPLAAVTSGRRLLHGGVARTALRFAWLKLRFALGADPARLRADYPDAR